MAKAAAVAVEVLDDAAQPTRRPEILAELAQYAPAVEEAIKNPDKRLGLKGRYSVKPREGRKNANESYTVMMRLHQAAKDKGVALKVRRFDNDGDTCRISFRLAQPGEKPSTEG